MHWVRAYPRLGSSLALFGLMLQLVLSLGHLHSKDIVAEPARGIAAAAGGHSHDGLPPAGPHPQHEDEYCAIYAFIALLGSAHGSDPPVLLLPRAWHGEPLAACRAFHIAKPARIIPEARAPPLA
jgi:hypothetical protein